MESNTTYSHSRLQKAIGNIAGTHLGFTSSPEGGVKPLPDTITQIVRIRRIYPTKRMVEFCFRNSEDKKGYMAHALVDHWYKEGKDLDNTNITNIEENLLGEKGEHLSTRDTNSSSWPFAAPETQSLDLVHVLMIISLFYPPAAALIPLAKIAGDITPFLELLTSSSSNILENIQKGANTDETLKLINEEAENLLENNEKKKEYIEPQEPLHGTIIPIKGDKNYGYLFTGFIKI